MENKKAQVTIFIIIAILIVAGVAAFFLLRTSTMSSDIPSNFQPAYTSFLSCLEQDTFAGIGILQSQGGYIELPEFEPGSTHMPFSSQLNFLGNPIPYWYYVSGNNVQRENVPSLGDMESQLETFIESKVDGCDFNEYHEQGFEITTDGPIVKAKIRDRTVEIDLNMDLAISQDDETVLVRSHNVIVSSSLGSLYDSARRIYDEEQENLFLEDYAIDNLRLYAPVDGVEITCSPLIWNAEVIFDELHEAIEANTLALKNEGSGDDYFNVDVPANHDVRFITSRDWSSSFEVSPTDGGPLLVSNPVGNQQGMGIIGFCYVPYHYVYDVKYPVLVQVQEGDEIFQFPTAVIIENNNPRESLEVDAVESLVPELCTYRNTGVSVSVRDSKGASVKADISYECFGNKCNIGETSDSGFLNDNFPQCVNGFVVAKAEGYRDSRNLFSTTETGSVNVVLEKIYTRDIQLKLDGLNYNENAIIYFTGDDSTETVVYPEKRTVNLGRGQYEVKVYIYKDSSITIGATKTEQCIEVPRGVLGVFGITKERCFDIEVPEQIISQALVGGGSEDYFIFESELINSNTIEISTEGFPIPEVLEQIHTNSILFENQGLGINFKQ